MFRKFSLWMCLMSMWIKSSRKCRKLRYHRDVLYKHLGISVFEMMPDDLVKVCDQIDAELKR